ncbi:MAG: radical SAM family heme chaperone HemW [Butyrivibrio sp.]|nr:radical SAM family heme chaperone HemW [Butyrivibrio sp.]
MKNLSIYIHIPFCVRKCLYCDFLSFPADTTLQESYFNALFAEILYYRDKLKDSGYLVSTIFIGGGTPSFPESVWITRLMEMIRKSFDISENCEITMELNPGTETPDKLKEYKAAGINRLSIGLQSANDEELRKIGRIHDYKTFFDCYRDVREAGFKNVNIDIMSALPGQSIDSYTETLEKVCRLSPEHISAYSLIVEEGTPFYTMYEDMKGLPTEDEDREMYEKTLEVLTKYGYHRYEISNYSKEGFECRHNKVYWQRGDYLGLGLGSASLMDNCRWNNCRNIKSYIDNSGTPDKIIENLEQLSIYSQMEEFMFLGLRLISGVSLNDFEKNFGKDIHDIYGKQIKKFIDEELLEKEGEYIKLTSKGLDVSNYVMSDFLLD